MICTGAGIGLRKPELAALLGFAKKYKADKPSHLAVVQFVVRNDRCFAYSTDGHRAIEADGESDQVHADGEWLVVREPLDRALKSLDGEQVLRLSFSGASLNTLIVEDSVGGEVVTQTLARDAAPEQPQFPPVAQALKLPLHRIGRPTTLNTKFLADLQLISKAADRGGIDIYPPEAPTGPTFFRCSGDPTTTWTAVICAMGNAEAEAPDEGDEEDGESKQPGLFDDVEDAVSKLRETLDEHGATMRVSVGDDQMEITGKKGRKKRSSKK